MPHAGTYMLYFSMLCTTALACSESVPAFIYLFDTSMHINIVFRNYLNRFIASTCYLLILYANHADLICSCPHYSTMKMKWHKYT